MNYSNILSQNILQNIIEKTQQIFVVFCFLIIAGYLPPIFQ